jgi:hypothetical protein
VAIEVFSDGHDRLFEILKDAAPEPVLGQSMASIMNNPVACGGVVHSEKPAF